MSDKVSVDQVLAALEQGKIAARPFQAVHIDPRRARKLKKYNPVTGEVTGEIASNEALERLLDDAKIRYQELEAIDRQEAKKAWDAVYERRKQGIPDCCADCRMALSMSRPAVRFRNRKTIPDFKCKICAALKFLSKFQATRTPEQRSEAMSRANASRTSEQRSEIARRARRAAGSGNASKTTEQRSEAASRANASRTPEQRSEAARRANASRTPEQRSEIVRKAHATRRAKAARQVAA